MKKKAFFAAALCLVLFCMAREGAAAPPQGWGAPPPIQQPQAPAVRGYLPVPAWMNGTWLNRQLGFAITYDRYQYAVSYNGMLMERGRCFVDPQDRTVLYAESTQGQNRGEKFTNRIVPINARTFRLILPDGNPCLMQKVR